MAHNLTSEHVLFIHDFLVDWFARSDDPISPPGVKNLDSLESAVARPHQSAGGANPYNTPFEKAAALFHSIINNHPFHNGNKRTALLSACVMLDSSGQWLEKCSDDELFEFTRQTAAHEICEKRIDEVSFIVSWMERHSRKRSKQEQPLKYRELKGILSEFGFEIDPPDGEILNIYKEGKIVEKIIKQGIKGFRPYHTHYIAKLRKKLKLTPEYGVDSEVFYGKVVLEDVLSGIIQLRSEVVRRLAKT